MKNKLNCFIVPKLSLRRFGVYSSLRQDRLLVSSNEAVFLCCFSCRWYGHPRHVIVLFAVRRWAFRPCMCGFHELIVLVGPVVSKKTGVENDVGGWNG